MLISLFICLLNLKNDSGISDEILQHYHKISPRCNIFIAVEVELLWIPTCNISDPSH